MNGVSAIAYTNDVTLITFDSVPSQSGVIADIFTDFAASGLNIDMISQSSLHEDNVSVSFTVNSSELGTILDLTKKIREKHNGLKVFVNSGNSKISLYGDEMKHQCGVAATAIRCVSHAVDQIQLITTSEVDISLLVLSPFLEQAIKSLETQFQVKAKQSKV